MAKSRKLPLVSEPLVLEQESRSQVEDFLRPWAVQRWTEADVGVDAIVEIRSHVSKGGVEPSGRRFNLQLKSTRAKSAPSSVIVKTATLRYWLNKAADAGIPPHARLPTAQPLAPPGAASVTLSVAGRCLARDGGRSWASFKFGCKRIWHSRA
jgi:hypothetical protein